MNALSRSTALALLCALVALYTSGPPARAARPAAQAAPFRVYLPAVAGSGAPARADRPQVSLTLDAGRAVSAEIGPAGGSLRATAADGAQITLTIPAEALDYSEPITITPALAAAGLPLSGGMLAAVRIEPAGIAFIEPAALTIIPAAAPRAPRIVGFSAGEEFSLMPAVAGAGLQAGGPGVTTAIHATGSYGAAAGSAADIMAVQAAAPPSSPAVVLAEAELLDPPASLGLKLARLDLLLYDYVEPAIQQAMADPGALEVALQTLDAWSSMVESWQVLGSMDTKKTLAYEHMRAAVQHAAAVAGERCYSQKRPEESFRLRRYLRYAQLYHLDPALIGQIQDRIARCLRFRLVFTSSVTSRAGTGGYNYRLRAEATLQSAGGGRAVGAGPLTWVEYRYVGSTAPCTFITSGSPSTFDAKSSDFGLRLTPVSRTSPQVKVSLRYTIGRPLEHLTVQCPTGTTAAPTTAAWADYFTVLHEYEYDARTKSINTATQVANVGTFTGWVYQNSINKGGEVVEYSQIEIVHAPQR